MRFYLQSGGSSYSAKFFCDVAACRGRVVVVGEGGGGGHGSNVAIFRDYSNMKRRTALCLQWRACDLPAVSSLHFSSLRANWAIMTHINSNWT